MNRRVQTAFDNLEAAQSQLREILLDLAAREPSPHFKRALALYDRGYRVSGWGLVLTDTSNETRFWNIDESPLTKSVTFASGKVGDISVQYFADGVDRRTEHVPEYLALHESDLGDEDEMYDALDYLDDLTEEARSDS